MINRAFALLAIVFLTASFAFAQRDLKVIPSTDVDDEQKTFILPEGFEVNLFAADPAIAKPIQMNFDESGRLWIASSEVYPHIEPGAGMTDRVLVLEDKDKDGVSDETHIFAEGLLIPTGIAPGDAGVYVANSTELLHFADADNDLKADSKRVVLSGFGTEDTHHILHTLRWGPDGYLYFNQSIYIHSHIETPWGVRRLNAGGIWQFRPETLELGVFMRGLVNSWGHHFDRFGQSFATDGAGGEGINYIVPGAYYFTAADAPKILHGLNPGSPKHCGLEIVETPMLPPDWQGSAITNDFRGHRVCRFTLSEDRSGFVSRQQQEVIKSNHPAFRPIDVKLGPDGAIYIADWYNPIIQHGEVDFRDPRRDHTHGRIWRVTWKGAPERDQPDISELPTSGLLNLLSDADKFRRQSAHQILRQRGHDVLSDLDAWQKSIPRSKDTEQLRLEALWCYQSLRSFNASLLEELLNAEDGRVRAAAVRVLSHWRYEFSGATKWLAKLVNDAHPRVRLEAVRAISYSPNNDSEALSAGDVELGAAIPQFGANDLIETALKALDHPTDRFLDYSIWLTSRELSSRWIPAFEKGEIDFDGNITHLLAAFTAVGRGAPVDFLMDRLYADSTSAPQRQQVTSLVAKSGTPQQLAKFVDLAAANKNSMAIQQLLGATRNRQNLAVPVSKETIDSLLASTDSALRLAAIKASGQWKLQGASQLLKGIAEQQDKSVEDRAAALEGLALFGGKQHEEFLKSTSENKDSPKRLRVHAAALLTGMNAPSGARVAARLFAEMKAEDHPENLTRSFLAVRNGTRHLANALAGQSMSSDVAREILRVVRESGQASAELETAVKTAGKITSRKELSPEARQKLLEMAMNDSTASTGERIFRMEKLGCLKCHAIGGAGGKVGPDMVSLGGSAQPDYLLESLLNPNAKVKENYHTIVIATDEGKIISGVQVKQAKEEVVVRNAKDELVTVPRSQIEDIAQGVSLMPEGQVDDLTDRELASLVRFLSELGRTPEYTISRRQFARTWEVLQATKEAAFRLRRTSYDTAATDDPAFQWKKGYSQVSGQYPLDELPVVAVRNRSASGTRGVGFVRCDLKVETAGQVALGLNDTAGLQVWLGTQPIDVADEMSIKLTPRQHRITVAINQEERSTPLELEIIGEKTVAVAAFKN